VLKEARIVSTRREGVFIYYSLNKETFKEFNKWLIPFLPTQEISKMKIKDKSTEPKSVKKENPFDKFQSEF
jgi:DNA-binding transcriptional ArsR family regulator